MPKIVSNDKRPMGAGDLVQSLAKPIAKAIDSATGHRTDIEHCAQCEKRRQFLNKMIPFGK